MRDDTLLALVLVMVPLSFMAIGGGAAIMGPLHDQSVTVHGWLTQREFIDLFAISRASPGPGAMIVTLIGWKVAGVWGAIVATVAMFLPTALLCYWTAKVWNRYRGTRAHAALEAGLTPIGVGLIITSTMAILRASDAGPLGWALAAAATALLMWRNFHPLMILCAGGVLYLIGGSVFGLR